MKYQNSINEQIKSVERELALLDAKKKVLKARIRQLKDLKQSNADDQLLFDQRSESSITMESTQEQKIVLFRALFRGREDVYDLA